MLAKVTSCAVVGLDGAIIEVEVDISPGLPSFTIVGLPDTGVQEARKRVRAAIRNSGCSFPTRRITVNLAPADLKKAGPAYDLPIAIGILLSSEQIYADISNMLFLGELSLDGSLRHTNGILPMTALAKEKGFLEVFVPEEDANEASILGDIEVIPVVSPAQLVSHLRGEILIPPHQSSIDWANTNSDSSRFDLAHIKGQELAKRAIEVAAAGGHNMLMYGAPGTGKTMLARALSSIMPDMTLPEAVEVTKIYSVSGLLAQDSRLMN